MWFIEGLLRSWRFNWEIISFDAEIPFIHFFQSLSHQRVRGDSIGCWYFDKRRIKKRVWEVMSSARLVIFFWWIGFSFWDGEKIRVEGQGILGFGFRWEGEGFIYLLLLFVKEGKEMKEGGRSINQPPHPPFSQSHYSQFPPRSQPDIVETSLRCVCE